MIDAERLNEACRRVEDFTAVHRSASPEERAEAAGVLLEAAGLTDELRVLLGDWMDAVGIAPKRQGAFLLGFLLAFFALDTDL